MKNLSLTYSYRYTTSGSAHRYDTSKKAKINIGSLYLRGVADHPKRLKVSIEPID